MARLGVSVHHCLGNSSLILMFTSVVPFRDESVIRRRLYESKSSSCCNEMKHVEESWDKVSHVKTNSWKINENCIAG